MSHAYPPFADGGIATSPQFALFGEAGPEAFIPLKGGRVPVEMSPGQSSKSAPQVTLNVSVASNVQANDFLKNEQQIMGMIARHLQQYVSRR